MRPVSVRWPMTEKSSSHLWKMAARHVLPVRPQHHQHALLAFRQHHLVGGHAVLALRAGIEVQLDADVTLARHLDGRAGQPGGPHVLDGDDRVRRHQLEAGFDQQLFDVGVAHLHGGALGVRICVELGRSHGRAVDAVPPGSGADIDDGVADAGGGGQKNAILPGDAHRHGVDQRVAVVGGMEVHLAAHRGHAHAVAVAADAAHHAIDDAFGIRIVG